MKKLAMTLLALVAAVAALCMPASAEMVSDALTSSQQTVTLTKTEDEQWLGSVLGTLCFEVVWEDTTLELKQTNRYEYVWNGETLKYEKVPVEGYSSYSMSDTITCTVTNRGVGELVAVPEFAPLPEYENCFVVQKAHKRTSANTWEWADEETLAGVTGLSSTPNDTEVGIVGETGEYQIRVDLAYDTSSLKPGDTLWENLQNGDSVGNVTVTVRRP